LSKKHWIKPEPDWLPLRKAPFALLKRGASPRLAVPEEVSPSEPLERIEDWAAVEKTHLGENDETSVEAVEQILAEKSGAERVEIDPKGATFSFWFGPPQTGGGTSVISGSPWVILDWEQRETAVDPRREAEDLFDPRCITVDDQTAAREAKRYRAICRATGLVWRQYMLRSFDRAVSRGTAMLIGRPKTFSAPFERLPGDVWPLLQVIDWENGVAVAPDGTRYFSIHAVIVVKSATQGPSLKPAPPVVISKAITEVYDRAQGSGEKPPNIKELPAHVLRLLKAKGLHASGRQVMKLAENPEHARRRRSPGKTVRSEKRSPRA